MRTLDRKKEIQKDDNAYNAHTHHTHRGCFVPVVRCRYAVRCGSFIGIFRRIFNILLCCVCVVIFGARARVRLSREMDGQC